MTVHLRHKVRLNNNYFRAIYAVGENIATRRYGVTDTFQWLWKFEHIAKVKVVTNMLLNSEVD